MCAHTHLCDAHGTGICVSSVRVSTQKSREVGVQNQAYGPAPPVLVAVMIGRWRRAASAVLPSISRNGVDAAHPLPCDPAFSLLGTYLDKTTTQKVHA